MSSTPRVQSSSSQSSPPDLTLVASTIARLRAEHDATESEPTKAILLHEIAVLEERLGDEAASARDELASVNTDPEFREPLERLIAIIERRQSHKNLAKLLERLVRVADRPDERARALHDQAAYLADHENDLAQARGLLEQAVEDAPDDSSLWLAIELLACRAGDAELREKALLRRCELAQDSCWRALLLIDLAEIKAKSGDLTAAETALEEAVERGSEATFQALTTLERLGREHDRPDLYATALSRQAAEILRAQDDPGLGDALGVPRAGRNRAHAAALLLEAAEVQRGRGETAGAVTLLDQALEQLAREPTLIRARMNAAEAAGDTATAARIARGEIEAGAKGEFAAALWLRVAEAAAADGDGAAAREAVEKALREDPGSIPARALDLDLLGGGAHPQALAAALESAADQFQTEDAKARYYLLSAEVWARQAKDTQGARAALSQAGMYGAPPSLVARLARLLADLATDANWYEEATRRLLAQGAGENEQIGLWFELARARALRGDKTGTSQAFDAIAAAPGGAWLGRALSAYVLELLPSTPETEASKPEQEAQKNWATVKQLAEAESDVETARALSMIVVLRAITRGEIDTAAEELKELHRADPANITVTATLAVLERGRGNLKQTATVLAATASATDDSALGAALQLEAGITYWQAGERSTAIDCFMQAGDRSAQAGSVTLGWALRAADPDNVGARRRALELAQESEPQLTALERFGLEVGQGGDQHAAREALERFDENAAEQLRTAGALAQSLWGSGAAAADARRAGLDVLADKSSTAAALARAAGFQLELSLNTTGASTERVAEAAERWALADPSLPAALEWMGAALATGSLENEVRARRAVAEHMTGAPAAAMAASAELICALSGLEARGPLTAPEPAAKLANLELAPPGCDPRRRAHALLDIGETLGQDSLGVLTAMAGFNQLAAGDVAAALDSFRRVVDTHPEEVMGWEGLRAAAELGGERSTLAEACAALGDAVSNASAGAEYWEQAAFILLDEFKDEERGEFALSRAVARDVRRFEAFDRLFRSVRAKKDNTRLLELIAARLEVADQPDEIVKLFWERARVLRGQGDREGALAALENVRMLEPDHVGALALCGEIYITVQRFEEAADNLARLAAHPEAPQQQRLMSGVAAVDLYENKIGDVVRALEVLVQIHESKLSTLPVRERLAKVAAKAEAWDQATRVLEQLMQERETPAGRVEAARLSMAIHRDRIRKPQGAQRAVEKLLAEAPSDGEALDLVLTRVFDRTGTRHLLERGLASLVREVSHDPLDAKKVDRLARIAAELERPPLRQAALGALVALGVHTGATEQELGRLDQRVASVPQIAIDESALPHLADPEDTGPIAEIMRLLATTIALALGPSLAAFNVTKKERVDPRAGHPVRNEIAAWAGALGIGEFELYIGGNDPSGVSAVATEVPALVIGSKVTAPLSPRHRQAVARELFGLRRGTTVLRHREPTEVSALVVAACRIVEVDIPSPPFAMLAEFQRQLGKELPRRVKKLLPQQASALAHSGADPIAWYRAATSSLDRMAAIAAGDVSWVLFAGGVRGELSQSREGQARARRLLAFVLSPTYLELREQLGMGVR